jgi:Ca2+-transporting ATPase
VAADGRLLQTANLRINESAFTGESMPVEKDTHVVPADAPIHDRKNMVFMGTTVSHGRATAIVTATGMQTEIGRIAEAVRTAKKGKTPLQESVERLGHSLIWAVTGSVERLLAICTSLRERPRGIGPWMRPCVVVSSMPTRPWQAKPSGQSH